MQESQLRDLVANGLPKLATSALTGTYPMGFTAKVMPSRDHLLDSQVVGNQLIYTKNIQICAFLTMDSGLIVRLGQLAFPKHSRLEIPKMVIAANGEALNVVMSKLAYLIGKVDGDEDATIAPPIMINCSGIDRRVIMGGDSIFLSLSYMEISMLLIASIQMV